MRIAVGLLVWAVLWTPPALPQGSASSGRSAAAKRPLPPGMIPPGVDYRDIAVEAGLTGVNVSGSPTDKTYIIESTGTGVLVFDYDRDGLPDILLVNADRFRKDGPAPRHYLYRNKGGLKFEDVTEKSGIAHAGWAQGVCSGDIDDDGYDDVFIPHWGQNRLFKNRGDGTFQDETERRGLSEPGRRWGTGCVFLDYDRDGDLDLFVANYLILDTAKTPKPGDSAECRWKGLPVLCGPRGLPGESMSLYRNDGKGVFEDVSAQTGVEVEKLYYGFTPLTGDFDNDGWIDVYVACDSTASLFYRNQGDGTFEEMGVISGAAYNMDGQEQAGMGATAADFDEDGDLDIFKTNFSNDTHTFYLNEGEMMFSDETVSTGLAVNTSYLGWGTAFIDFDHDGWKDIFVGNGHVYPSIDSAPVNETFKQSRLLYWNRGDGQFHDISAAAGPGIAARHASRGIATADFDNDGSLEIVVVNMHERPSLLKNFAPKGESILIDARMPSGRPAFGTRIELRVGGRTMMSETRGGGNHISQSDPRVHFGLGSATTATLRVRWPNGEWADLGEVRAGRTVVAVMGKGVVDEKPFKKAGS